jgi:NAD+ synthase
LDVLPELSDAIPTDGLWEDTRTDESQLGATYDELEWAMKFLETNSGYPTEKTLEKHMTPRQGEILNIYNKWHYATRHKFDPIPTFTFRRKK